MDSGFIQYLGRQGSGDLILSDFAAHELSIIPIALSLLAFMIDANYWTRVGDRSHLAIAGLSAFVRVQRPFNHELMDNLD